MTQPILACDMSAISADQRAEHHKLIRRVVGDLATEITEIGDGFVFTFEPTAYDDVALFVAAERLCCPFLRFTLDVASERGPVTLSLRGPSGAVPFIRAELGIASPDTRLFR